MYLYSMAIIFLGVIKDVKSRGDSSFWVDVGVEFGYAALITVCLLIVACFLTIAGCYVCAGQRPRGRVVSIQTANQVMVQPLARPPWTLTISSDPNFSCHGFSFVGSGVTIINPNTVERNRSRQPITAGAKWSRGVTSGKHVFEVVWPEAFRGTSASVGIGSITTPLFAKGKVTLIGRTQTTWGFDVAKKQIFHNLLAIANCPPNLEEVIPERFLMYIDMDRGELGFGSLSQYWGVVARDIHCFDQPLYLMVGISVSKARVQVFYKGSSCSSAMRHPPPAPVSRGSRTPPDPPDPTDRDFELQKRATYQAIAAARARLLTTRGRDRFQAWREESSSLTPPREVSFRLPISPPPPYSRY